MTTTISSPAAVQGPSHWRRPSVPRAVRGWALPLLLLALWWVAVRLGWSQSPLLVPVEKVWATAVEQTVVTATHASALPTEPTQLVEVTPGQAV